MSVPERLQRERTQPQSATYRVLKGEITKKQYHDLVNQERRRHGLPEIKQAATEGS